MGSILRVTLSDCRVGDHLHAPPSMVSTMQQAHLDLRGGHAMRFLLRLMALLLLAPVILVLALLALAAAIAGIPLLWDALVRAYTAPPDRSAS